MSSLKSQRLYTIEKRVDRQKEISDATGAAEKKCDCSEGGI
jgi:hypothetical protein